MSYETRALCRAEEFVEWMRTSPDGRFPSIRSKDPVEHSLGVWIVQMRCAKRESRNKNNKNMRLFLSVEAFLDVNVPNWLDGAGRRLGDRETHCKEMASQIVAFHEKHGRLPVTTPGTPSEEQLLGRFLQRLRLGKREVSRGGKQTTTPGRSPWCFHPSVEKIMDEGIQNWWVSRRRDSSEKKA
jgi:hypothetical protein